MCGHPIPVSDVLTGQIRSEIEARLKLDEEKRIKAAAAAAEARARERSDQEVILLREQLAEQQRKVREAQAAELALRREKAALEERQRELDLEVARRLDTEKRALEETIRSTVSEELALKMKEKDKLIEDLKKHLAEAKRRSEQGSQELQGEVLELDLQAELERRFPHDVVTPVPKGMRGADLVHLVRDCALRPCGTIVWEAKNTRHWQLAWLDKLKEDQRAIGANLAGLVSVALPPDLGEFRQVEGVWVASLRVWPVLALALREQLVRVADAKRARGVAGENGASLLLPRGRPVPRPRSGDRGGVQRTAGPARAGAARDGAALARARKADRARASPHRWHVRRGAWHRR
jgi:hypothetical protein